MDINRFWTLQRIWFNRDHHLSCQWLLLNLKLNNLGPNYDKVVKSNQVWSYLTRSTLSNSRNSGNNIWLYTFDLVEKENFKTGITYWEIVMQPFFIWRDKSSSALAASNALECTYTLVLPSFMPIRMCFESPDERLSSGTLSWAASLQGFARQWLGEFKCKRADRCKLKMRKDGFSSRC